MIIQDKVGRQHVRLHPSSPEFTPVHRVLCDEDSLLPPPSGVTEQDWSEAPGTRARSDGAETATQRETQCVWRR